MKTENRDVEAWDEVFIRCRRDTVNAVVCDIAGWSTWWPGCDVTPLGGDRFEVHLRPPPRIPAVASLTRRGAARQELVITVDRIRPRDKGVELSISGDLEGTAEWFHLDGTDGVVVNHLIRGRLTHGNARRWLVAHRAAVRAGMTDLKRRLERGRTPGAEPHPDLLTHQAAELATFAREVAAHEAKLVEAAAEHEAGGRAGDAGGGSGSGQVAAHEAKLVEAAASQQDEAG